MWRLSAAVSCFFFNDTATTEIYTLSLHDALPIFKTHTKCVLVVRREGDGVRHYVHVGTGNYHPTTARLYTDLGLLSCDEDLGADVADMFNFLTGFARPAGYRKALVAPTHLRDAIVDEIDRTIAAHEQGKGRARIAMKMNA